MWKYIIGFFLVIIAVFALVNSNVYAGGCCFKSFSLVNGVAGRQDAEINVAFVDPTPSNDGKYTYSSLANQKIEIHIVSPQAGQSCQTTSENTDADGHIEARCSSPVAGPILVNFTAPNLDATANQSIQFVSKEVYFDANPEASIPSLTPTSTPYPTNTSVPQQSAVTVTQTVVPPSSTPTTMTAHVTPAVEPEIESTETVQLREKVAQLEKKVAAQDREVTSLKSVIQKMFTLLSKIFHS